MSRCLDCAHWQARKDRPWLEATLKDVGACRQQAQRLRHSSFWRVTAAAHECDCGEFLRKDVA